MNSDNEGVGVLREFSEAASNKEEEVKKSRWEATTGSKQKKLLRVHTCNLNLLLLENILIDKRK